MDTQIMTKKPWMRLRLKYSWGGCRLDSRRAIDGVAARAREAGFKLRPRGEFGGRPVSDLKLKSLKIHIRAKKVHLDSLPLDFDFVARDFDSIAPGLEFLPRAGARRARAPAGCSVRATP